MAARLPVLYLLMAATPRTSNVASSRACGSSRLQPAARRKLFRQARDGLEIGTRLLLRTATTSITNTMTQPAKAARSHFTRYLVLEERRSAFLMTWIHP